MRPRGHAADAERDVQRQRAGGDRVDLHLGALVAHAHDGALAELALDLRERALQGGVARLGVLGAHVLLCVSVPKCSEVWRPDRTDRYARVATESAREISAMRRAPSGS